METEVPAPGDPNLKAASKFQEKFDFYLIGLTFTVLGLAVQTAKFGHGKIIDGSELLAWVVLFVSGVFAFRRLEWTPTFFAEAAERDRLQGFATAFQRMRFDRRPLKDAETGALLDPGKLETEYKVAVRSRDDGLSTLNAKGTRRYRWQRLTFLSGILLLMLARGLEPLCHLFGYRLK